jgi:hypothetical protein
LKLFSLIFGVLVVVFIEDDDDGLIRMAAEKDLLCELENMFLILTPEIIQTLLRRTFDGGSSEDSMDDREVDSR